MFFKRYTEGNRTVRAKFCFLQITEESKGLLYAKTDAVLYITVQSQF